MAYSGKKSIDAIFREVRNAVFKTGGGKLVKDGDGRRYLNDGVCVPTGNLSGYDSGKSGFSGSEYDDSGETVKVVYTDGFGTQKDADIKLSRATGEFAGLMSPGDKESLEAMVGNNVTHLKVNKSTVDGKEAYLVDPGNLPSYVDDVVEGYYRSSDGKFYGTAVDDLSEPVSGVYDTIEKTVSTGGKTAIGTFYRTYSDEITGETGKIYVNLGDSDHKIYRYSGSTYVLISDVPEATLKEIEKKVDTSTFNSYKNATSATLQEMDSAIANAGNMQEVTYARLVELRGSGGLVAGTQYRITDFVTTVGSGVEHVRSAGHQFDVIVTADSAGTLNEVARAALHSGDEYFLNSKLRAWKIWYSLDNETGRFNWADGENGKGVIYRMIDEFGNDLPFDFKNVQFEMYHVDEVLSKDQDVAYGLNVFREDADTWSLKWWFAGGFSTEPIGVTTDDSGNKSYTGTSSGLWDPSPYGPSGTAVTIDSYTGKYSAEFQLGFGSAITFITSSERVSMYAYAFSLVGNASASPNIRDSSLDGMLNAVYENSVSPYALEYYRLPYVVFLGINCRFNAIGHSAQYVSIDKDCYNNRIGDSCGSIVMGVGCYENTFRNNCVDTFAGSGSYDIAVGNGSSYNTFVSGNYGNVLGNGCSYNIFYSGSKGNVLGNDSYSNVFGVDAHWNSVGNGCYRNKLLGGYNVFHNGCYLNTATGGYNIIGNNCNNNSAGASNCLGNDCSYNTLGTGNKIGYSCSGNSLSTGNTLGNNCKDNTIKGTNNSIGDGSYSNNIEELSKGNTIGSYCSYVGMDSYCNYNSVGDKCDWITIRNYSENNVLDGNNSTVTFNRSDNVASNIIKNYHFKSGVKNYIDKQLTPNLDYETTVALKSDGTKVTYNEADLYTGS